MSGYDNNMTGIMSRNERRERDSQPEFTGTLAMRFLRMKVAARLW